MLIAPLGVTTRQSSDVLAIDDRTVAAALRSIRERLRRMSMKDLLRQIPMSRSLLSAASVSIWADRRRLKSVPSNSSRVRQLLAESDLSLDQIAPLAGYAHPEYMSVVFKRETGQTPGQYRAATNAAMKGGDS